MAWGEASSLESAVQQVVRLVAAGYRYYLTDMVPERKDPAGLDSKLDELYELSLSEDQRYRRKAERKANVTLVRLGRWFVLMATPPRDLEAHRLYQRENHKIRSVRERPIRLGDYTISQKWSTVDSKWHVVVRLRRSVFLGLRARLVYEAEGLSKRKLEAEFRKLTYMGYTPVVEDLWRIFEAANHKRKERGLPELDKSCVPVRFVKSKPLKEAA